MAIQIELPFPPTDLRPNARKHPGINRIGREYGQAVWLSLREAFGPPRPGAPMMAAARMDLQAVYPSGRGVWDDDAVVAAFKKGRDQLKAFGVIADDAPRFLQLGSVTSRIDRDRRAPALIVTLTAIDPPAAGAAVPRRPRAPQGGTSVQAAVDRSEENRAERPQVSRGGARSRAKVVAGG